MSACGIQQSPTVAKMTKPATLTPSQAAAVLNVSPSTLRRWSADFADHLSESARGAGGKHRTYSPEDLAMLKRAGELLKTHSPGEVAARLGLADETQQTAALITLPAIGAELQAAHDLIVHLRGEVAALSEARQADRAELETVRASFQQFAARQVKRNKYRQAELEELRAEVEALKATPARRHWWQRLRGG